MRSTASAALLFAAAMFTSPAWAAPETVVAKVNGRDITEAELKFAEAEIDLELSSVPAENRRAELVRYLVDAYLMADAAEKAKLTEGSDFTARMNYYRLRAVRDTFFEKQIRDSVTEAEARAFYEQRAKPQEEVRIRHVLVGTEEEAKKVAAEVAGGADFAEVAKKSSQQGAGENGGDLGYFVRGQLQIQMIEAFENAAFTVETGKISAPVQTEFGWHILKVEDKRQRQPQAFEELKDRIKSLMVQAKLDTTVRDLRKNGTVEIVDPEIKKVTEAAEKLDGAKPEAEKKQ